MNRFITDDILNEEHNDNNNGVKEEKVVNYDEFGTVIDEPILFEPIVFDREEISEHIGTITAMEAKLEDLLYLADAIEKSKGMNQSFAMEAEKLLPGFGAVPIGFYTKDTTATRYKVSLEEISKSMWGVIAAVALAIAAMIGKLIKWLFSDKKDSATDATKSSKSATPENIKASTEKRKEDKKAFDGINAELKKPDTFNNVDKIKVPRDVDELVDDFLKETDSNVHPELRELLNSGNGLYSDVLKEGRYFKLMFFICGKVSSIPFVFKIIQEDIEAFKKAAIEANSVKQPNVGIDDMQAKVDNIGKRVNKIDIENKGELTYGDAIKYLKSVRDEVSQEVGNTKISFTTAMDMFDKAVERSKMLYLSEDIVSFKDDMEKINNALKDVADELTSIERKAATGNLQNSIDTTSAAFIKILQVKLKEIREEVTGCFSFVALVQEYLDTLQLMGCKLAYMRVSVAKVIEISIKAYNENEVPSSIKEYLKTLKSKE